MTEPILDKLAGQMPPDPSERVRELVEEVIEGSALYVVEVNVRGRTGSQVVEVYLDADGPLGIDELATVSRELGLLIETEDLIKGKYQLNVSSPGADRPLVDPRQYRKHLGRTLRIKRHDAPDVEGELVLADAQRIEIAPKKGPSVQIGYDEIDEAKVQLPW